MLWASKVEIFWTWKNFEQNYFSSAQWIKNQKMFRIMKKDVCGIYIKIGAKKNGRRFINRT